MTEEELAEKARQITKIVQEIADADCRSIGYFSVVPVEGRTAKNWSIYWGTEIDDLFAMPDYRVAQILSVLGSEVRLSILKLLLKKPMTAAEIVTELKMTTTGQAYHHLKELQRAGYVQLQLGGRFHVNMRVARVYVAALALAANAGALIPEDIDEGEASK